MTPYYLSINSRIVNSTTEWNCGSWYYTQSISLPQLSQLIGFCLGLENSIQDYHNT